MKTVYIATMIVISLFILASCTLQPATTPTPVSSGTTPRPSPTAISPSVSPQDTAWNKVVEAAKKEGLVTIYAFYYGGDIGRSMARAFQDKYGIRVEILASAGRQTVEKVKVEQAMKQPVA
ncbi:MAG: Ferric transporter ATP-binding subunit, partial [Dehalococcoidia bacterium]|nr:Ferric transporter ATP-binding subunit [Dehalococcoidia bacterium]